MSSKLRMKPWDAMHLIQEFDSLASEEAVITFEVRRSRRPNRIRLVFGLLVLVSAPVFTCLLRLWVGWIISVPTVFFLVSLVWWALENNFAKRFPPGVDSLRITSRGISSPFFGGNHQSFEWSQVAAVKVICHSYGIAMDVELKNEQPNTSAALPQRRRSSRFGRGQVRRLPLDMFEDAAQEAIIDAVNKAVVPKHSSGQRVPDNPLAVERRFMEQLRALTPRPWITWSLAAVNVAVWGAIVLMGTDGLRTTPSTLFGWGGNSAWEVQHGAWWRLGSSMFLHGSLQHLILNMAALIWLGQLAERLLGSRAFVLLYALSGLAGSALSLSFGAQKSVAVGASGAIFGVAGALVAIVWRHHGRLPTLFTGRTKAVLTSYVIYSLLNGFARSGVDNAAHIGGLVSGGLMACLLPLQIEKRQPVDKPRRPVLWAAFAGSVLVAVLAVAAPVSQINHRALLQIDRAFPNAMRRFQSLMHALTQEDAEIGAGGARAWKAQQRKRTKHAPEALAISRELERIKLASNDPRYRLLNITQSILYCLHEMLKMPSVPEPATGNPMPRDLSRYATIKSRFDVLVQSMKSEGNALSKRKS